MRQLTRLAAIALLTLSLLAASAPIEAQSSQPGTASSVPLVDNPPLTISSAPSTEASRPTEYTRVPGSADDHPLYYTSHTPFEFYLTMLCAGILAATIIVLAFMGRTSGLTTDFTRTFIIVVIVFAALFLVAAGYSDVQAAPVYGLLGTIAGYIFGRTVGAEQASAGGESNNGANGGPAQTPSPKNGDTLSEGVIPKPAPAK